MVGDFNAVLSRSKNKGRAMIESQSKALEFDEFMERIELIDF